jgi:L-asparaginase / beta-aspartyl-peptidase
MKCHRCIFIVALFFLSISMINAQKWTIAVHGGAGNITPENTTDSAAYKAALDTALNIGISVLSSGGSSLDAVEKVIRYFEDNPLFNAGRGAVLTIKGEAELDASIMDGKTLQAGAIAGVKDIKNPISCARKVMEKSEHVFLSGSGASEFAALNGLEIVDNSYFITDSRKKMWEKSLKKPDGTVGCVAVDINGNLAAGTSTGGMMNKKYGRIGDSPVIGAGTYASNSSCAVSCTGHGEYFIRNVVAFHIHSLVYYLKMDIDSAASLVFNEYLTPQGGTGGVIIVDKNGNYCFHFNTPGMFRAAANSSGVKEIKLFK